MTPLRLSDVSRDQLPSSAVQPRYDRRAATDGVVHLGIGAFHRAHQAVYFDDLLARDLRWGVIGASLRSSGIRDKLVPQHGLYTLVERDGEREQHRIIGAVRDVLVAPEAPSHLVTAMADPAVHLVSLTVTEKGYKLDPASGELLRDDPDIRADLATPAKPRTAPGFLVAALAERRARGLPPFTVLSCDNLPENGERVRTAVLALAAVNDPILRDWIADRGVFPNTMVDRIVPATTQADVGDLSRTFGFEDQGMVKTEPFTQWVIEDRFAGERPDFGSVGVQMTHDVRPWEEAKLRLLNGAHSAIAYLGSMSGAEFVHEAVARPAMRCFVDRLWDEAEATLSPPPSLSIAAYRAQLMARFENSALRHRTRQIAADGSQKIPQRLLAPIAHRLSTGASVDALSLAVASWMRWQREVDETGTVYTVDDPLAPLTRSAWGASSIEGVVDRFMALEQIFPLDLTSDERFRDALTRHLASLTSLGAIQTLEAFAREHAR